MKNNKINNINNAPEVSLLYLLFILGAIVVNFSYMYWMIPISIGGGLTSDIASRLSITAYVYMLFATTKLMYGMSAEDKSLYKIGIKDCLFVLVTLYYMSSGILGIMGIILIMLKGLEMLMYVKMQKHPIKNGSRKGDK